MKKGLNNNSKNSNYNNNKKYDNQENDHNNDNGVNEYVIASKNRTVTLQFASPIRRKRTTNGFKQRKQKEEVAPYVTVRGIKNLSNNPSPTGQKIQKKTGGLGLFFKRYIPIPQRASKVFIKLKTDFLLAILGSEMEFVFV